MGSRQRFISGASLDGDRECSPGTSSAPGGSAFWGLLTEQEDALTFPAPKSAIPQGVALAVASPGLLSCCMHLRGHQTLTGAWPRAFTSSRLCIFRK